MKGLLKGPLILAAIVVILRVVVERAGVPSWMSNALSAVALICLVGPIYFAIKIAGSGNPRPYSTQFKTTALYAVLVRAMILPAYWLAFAFGWQDQRFAIPSELGNSALAGYVIVPGVTAIFWIITATIVGGALGSLIIAIRRRSA
jgi:succinate dehydrogenase hydrophobic anchor subunit